MQTLPDSQRDLAQVLAENFPPLQRYWPRLTTVSVPQAAFFFADDREILYGGAAGGGKSDALLAGALQYMDVPGYAALILRRTFKQLSLPGAIMARSKEWLRPHPEVRWADDDKTWTFPSGATLTFGFLEHQDDIYRYQGPEFQYIAFDELTQFYEGQYTYMFSRLRRHVGIDVPVRVRAASNPGGLGHTWVRKRFAIPTGPAARPIRADKQRVFIPAKIADNPGLDPVEYEDSLGELSPALRSQLMRGDWGAFEGAAYPDFTPRLHLVDPFEIPEPWDRFEHMDFGSSNPTAWHVTATDYDGNLVVFDEYYKPGLASEHGRAILARREAGWQRTDDRGWPVTNTVYADPAVWAETGVSDRLGRPASVANEFGDLGIGLSRGNNSRRAGHVRVRELLAPDPKRLFPAWHPLAGEHGAPRLFIVGVRCPHLVEQLQTAPLLDIESGRNQAGEIVDPDWESRHGHAHASLRYGVMSRPGPSAEPEQPPSTVEEVRAAYSERLMAHMRDRPAVSEIVY